MSSPEKYHLKITIIIIIININSNIFMLKNTTVTKTK